MDITLTLVILLIAIILFATEWLRMDIVSLMILLAVALTGLVTPEEAFSGFSNPAVITVAAMFVLGTGISHTGAIAKFGEQLIERTGHNQTLMIVSIMGTVALFSAFINNIGATAVLMPVVIMVARRTKLPASKLLIPLAFGSLLGGVCTLIGTPPNILINELLLEYTGEGFQIFSFTPLGLVLLACGISYMALFGHKLLPERKSGTLTEAYQVKEYITEIEILEGSPLDGQTISQSKLEREFNMKVRAMLRNKRKYLRPKRNRKLHVGDVIFLEGDPEGILKVMKEKSLLVVPERDNPLPGTADEKFVVVEASLDPTSDMVGKTLSQERFSSIHGLTVLAIWRSGAPVVRKVEHVILQFGDVLLLQGPEEKVRHLAKGHGFLVLGGVAPVPYRPRRAPIAVGTIFGVILLTVTGVGANHGRRNLWRSDHGFDPLPDDQRGLRQHRLADHHPDRRHPAAWSCHAEQRRRRASGPFDHRGGRLIRAMDRAGRGFPDHLLSHRSDEPRCSGSAGRTDRLQHRG